MTTPTPDTSQKRRRKANRLDFGSVRQLPSGRWQARYPDPKGKSMTAPRTFDSKADALDHIAEVRADRLRGTYRDHRDGAEHFDVYARSWIDNGGRRGKLAPRTRELYDDLLARDLAHFKGMPVSAITPREVRDWYARLGKELAKRARSRGGTGESRRRQAYALLRGILATAVEDSMIGSNPCRITGAGVARAEERPYMDPATLAAIVEKMPVIYQTPLRVMFGAHLRLGELIGLERGDYDPERRVLRVERQVILVDGKPTTTPTKSGQARDVALPPSIAALIAAHLADTKAFGRSPMFVGRDGQAMKRSALQTAWKRAAIAAGAKGFHLHDVRHSGLTVAAQSGATTKELMSRGGHRTPHAALIYQHVASERNELLAAQIDALAGGAFGAPNGTRLAQPATQKAIGQAAERTENPL